MPRPNPLTFRDAYVDQWLDGLRRANGYRKLFITGCPKSGTTWLTQVLNGHPAIVANGEGRFAHRLFGSLRAAVDAFNQDHAASRASSLGTVPGEDVAMMYRVAADSTLLRYLAASGRDPAVVRVLADKTPQHVLQAELLRAIYPGCVFVNIIRDPRDAATSALFHLAKHDPRPTREYVTAFVGDTWRLHVAAALEAERTMGPQTFLNVRYEDLHADPDPVIRRCLTHVGVDATDAAVTACREAGQFERLSGGRQRGQVDPTSFYRNGQVGDWRNHLSPDLARVACAGVAGLMRQVGYDAVDPAPDAGTATAGVPAAKRVPSRVRVTTRAFPTRPLAAARAVEPMGAAV